MKSAGDKRSILVTGGAGFIGSHVVDRLLQTGLWRVTVIDNFNDTYDPGFKRANIADHRLNGDFRLVEADLLDPDTMSSAFVEGEFDSVIHLAALAGVRPSLENPLLYQRVNVEGTYRVLELARRHGVKHVLFGSSSSVYGFRSTVPFSETDDVSRPASPYAATKIAGEAACAVTSHIYGTRILCLRFFTVYGPRQRPDLAIRKFATLMSEGRPIPLFGNGQTMRDYTHIDDVVDGVMSALEYDRTEFEIINLGGQVPVALTDLVEILSRTIGVEPTIEWLPDQPGDVPRTAANIDKARALLGYAPRVDLETGLRRFADWLLALRSSPSLR